MLRDSDEYLKAVEQYQDYEAGTYQSMTLEEKMDFFDGIHTNRIHNIACYYKLDGITYLLSHLREVPSRGYEYGLFWSIRSFIKDDSAYPLVKKALVQISPNDSEFVLQILEGTDIPAILGIDSETRGFPLLSECGDEIELKRKSELEDMLSGPAKK